MTKYEYEYYSVPKNDRIQIQILFGFPKMTEYEYYSATHKWPNTNTNIIQFPKNDLILIPLLFCFPIMTKYKYQSLQDQFWVSQGDAEFAESSDNWS